MGVEFSFVDGTVEEINKILQIKSATSTNSNQSYEFSFSNARFCVNDSLDSPKSTLEMSSEWSTKKWRKPMYST
jgi:hypothetical protein